MQFHWSYKSKVPHKSHMHFPIKTQVRHGQSIHKYKARTGRAIVSNSYMHFHWRHKSLQHGMETMRRTSHRCTSIGVTNHCSMAWKQITVPHKSRNCVQLKHALPLESQINAAWRGHKSKTCRYGCSLT